MKAFRSTTGLLIIFLLCFNEFACVPQRKNHPKFGGDTQRMNGLSLNKRASKRNLEDTESRFELIFHITKENSNCKLIRAKDEPFPIEDTYLIINGETIIVLNLCLNFC